MVIRSDPPRLVIIPQRKDLPIGTLRGILRQAGLTTEEKIDRLRQYREARYEQLIDAVYARRDWDNNGIPTLQTLRRLGIDLEEVIDLVQ